MTSPSFLAAPPPVSFRSLALFHGPQHYVASAAGLQDGEALGRSRGGFSTKIHLKADLDGYPIGFHLTGGEASDSRNFEVLLDLGPDVDPRFSKAVEDRGADEGAAIVIVSAKIESEIAVLAENEQKEYLEALGLAEPGLSRVIRAGYGLLRLVTFFTVGPKETRAWTIPKGTKASQAAGVVHTDFEKGFTRAETIAYADYVAFHGEAGAREAGKFRLEGKDYLVADGDVLHTRFFYCERDLYDRRKCHRRDSARSKGLTQCTMDRLHARIFGITCYSSGHRLD